MSCAECYTRLDAVNCMNCNACKASFCYKCLNVTSDLTSSLSKKSLADLKCPSCSNVTRRRQGENLSLRSETRESEDLNALNMSCDNLQKTPPSHGLNSIPKSDKSTQAVTLDSISRLLDQKLSPSSAVMISLRESLRNDFKQMMTLEINKTMQILKDDFTHTTDFITECQTEMQVKLTASENEIKSLEQKNQLLQDGMSVLQSRLRTLEQMSRNLNVELQAVPESRSENVVALFNALCANLGLQVVDSDIRACRRVAKVNAASSRPRNIIVTLSSTRLRDTLLSAAHRYNKAHPKDRLGTTQLGLPGEHTRIFITEHLSPECKQLHAAARSFARDNNFKYVWVKNSLVYIRRDDNCNAIRIKDMNSFSAIK